MKTVNIKRFITENDDPVKFEEKFKDYISIVHYIPIYIHDTEYNDDIDEPIGYIKSYIAADESFEVELTENGEKVVERCGPDLRVKL